MRQAEQLGLGHAVLCAERAVGGDPFAVLLADDFLTDYEPGVTADLAQTFASTGKSQLSVMEVDGPDISRYGVVVPLGLVRVLRVWLKNLMRMMHPQPGFYRTIHSDG